MNFRKKNRGSNSKHKNHLFRGSNKPHAAKLSFENLEQRQLLSVTMPVYGSQLVQAGAPLNVALNATGTAAGDPISYTVSVSNATGCPNLSYSIPTGNTFLKFHIDDNGDNIHGDMIFELYNDLTPTTVEKISGLVNSGFYNGLTFHRVVDNFVIQGGGYSPDGTYHDPGAGFPFANEINSNLKFTSAGVLGMANAGGTNTNGSQFFVTSDPERFLDGYYTIFGFLVEGEDIRQQIEHVPVHSQSPNYPEASAPDNPVIITSASIVTNVTDAVLRLSASSGSTGTAIVTVTATDVVTHESATRSFHVYVEPDVGWNNHSPVLTSASPSLGTTKMTTPKTVSISSFINNGMNTTTVSDTDPGAVLGGIAITNLAGLGIWQYSLDGLNYVAVDKATVSSESALLLSKNAQLRYVPDGLHFETASVTYYAWDMTSGVDGGLAEIAGFSAFSTAADQATLTVAGNTAPVLVSVNAPPAVGPIMGSTSKDSPKTINLSSFINNGPGTTTITDVDTGDPVGGIAIIGIEGMGTWEYSLDGVTFLTILPMWDHSSSLLLPHEAKLRYTPDGVNSESAYIIYRAWDATSGVAGGRADLTSSSSYGGSTAFSQGYDAAQLVVNDAPVLVPANPLLGTISEDMTITFSLNNTFINSGVGTTTIVDPDANAKIGGIAIIGITGNGTWEYKSHINSSYLPIISVNLSSALLLSKTPASLRYIPDGKNGENATITYLAWDTTSGSNGQRVDLSQPGSTGGTTAFSSSSDTATLLVTSVNDAPFLTPANPTLSIPFSGLINLSPASFVNNGTGTTTISDVDAGAVVGGIALTNLTGSGTWEFTTDYTTYATLQPGSIRESNALLVAKNSGLRYTPLSDDGEIVTISYRAWDITSGSIGSRVDLTQPGSTGGSTDFSAQSDTATLTILPRFSPPTDITLSSNTLPENQSVGSQIGAFSTTSSNPGSPFTYSLVSGDGSEDNAAFAISGSNLLTAASFNFEAKSVYRIRVRTTGLDGLSVEKPFTVWVSDQPEIFSAAAGDWTAAGLTFKLDADGKLHLYRTGTAIDAVSPHNPANVTSINILGRDGADDALTVDLTGGVPIPPGGMVFNAGTQNKGDKLILKGSDEYDNVTLTRYQVNIAGAAAINYSQVELFGFDLGAGYDHLAIDHATLKIDRDNAISAGADVTIIGGTLDLGGKTDAIGDLKMIGGSIINGSLYAASYNILSGTATAVLNGVGALTKITSGQFNAGNIVASNVTVTAGTLSATSIVCDTLTIGSAQNAANAAAPQSNVASSASEAVVKIPNESTSDASSAIDLNAADASQMACGDSLDPIPSITAPAFASITVAQVPSQIQRESRISDSTLTQTLTAEQIPSPAFAAIRADRRISSANASAMFDLRQIGIYREEIDLATPMAERSALAPTARVTRGLALQSLADEEGLIVAIASESADSTLGKHFSDRNRIVVKAIDRLHTGLDAE